MADFTTYANGDVIANSAGSNAAGLPAVTVFENVYNPARGGVTNGDTCTQFIAIPAGSYVLGVMVEVITPESSVTLDVGDAADPNGFAAAQSLAVAGRFAGAGAYINSAGPVLPRFYAAETWLEFTVGGANLTVAEFRVAAVVANCG
jgi:hypothetical protein